MEKNIYINKEWKIIRLFIISVIFLQIFKRNNGIDLQNIQYFYQGRLTYTNMISPFFY